MPHCESQRLHRGVRYYDPKEGVINIRHELPLNSMYLPLQVELLQYLPSWTVAVDLDLIATYEVFQVHSHRTL